VDEILSGAYPAKVARIGVSNRFGQSGEPDELLAEYHMTPADIVKAAEDILK
jgi:transketolase